MISVYEAMVAFGKGFTYTRSFTHPYECVPIGPLWALRDAPGKKQDPRVEEILVHGIDPTEAVRIIREYRPHKYAICAIEPLGADHEALKNEYKSLGFRLRTREPLMVRDLSLSIPVSSANVTRVRDPEIASALNRVVGSRQILLNHLEEDDASLRQYAAFENGEAIGWVRSVDAGEKLRWVSNLFVEASHRRQGIASALMNAMLCDDARLGATHSVLLASNAGSQLYPTLGYEVIGLLQLFSPIR